MSAIIQEDIEETICKFLGFADTYLDSVDSTQRLSHVVPVVCLENPGSGEWRTRQEHSENPNRMSLNVGGGDQAISVHLSPPHRTRAALRQDSEDIARDLTVKLRRSYSSPRRDPW